MIKPDFDPNGVGSNNGNYFGLPFSAEESKLVLLSVPWDVTASYGKGSGYAPDAIIGASTQLDLYDSFFPGGWQSGIGTIGIDYSIQERSIFYGEDARKIIRHLELGGTTSDDSVRRKLERINTAHSALNDKVYQTAKKWIEKGKIVGVVGGDHSTPFGLIQAVAERGNIGLLQIDAHADLRVRYEGFEFSHASIMHNVVTKIEGVERLVQVGVRDMCDAEVDFALHNDKIDMFTDDTLCENRFKGVNWDTQCDQIVERLPKNVYISFDIDGLSPENCPHTGTPVAGGLSFNEAVYLIRKVATSGRTIVGFDLCEVVSATDNEWDANVGARIIYKMCNAALKTNI